MRQSDIYNPAVRYRAEIDGLRAVAVLPVLLFHGGFELFSGGFVGVDVFFVISGYLITSIILREISQGTFSIINFYERRARRILPALVFVVCCTVPFAMSWMLPEELERFGQSVAAVMAFASNIYFWRDSDYFAPAAEELPLLHTWSLAVEEQYYLLFPVFLVLFWRLGKNRLFWLTFFVALGSLALCEWASRVYPVPNYYLLPTRAWELVVGALIAFRTVLFPDALRVSEPAARTLAATGLMAILYAVFFFDSQTPFPSVYATIPTFGTAAVIAFANGRDATSRVLSLKPIVFLGLISYSTYLWHQPVFAFLRLSSFEPLTSTQFAVATIVSILLAAFTWRFVERPFRNRSGFDRASIFRFSTVGIVFLLVAGVTIAKSGPEEQLAGFSREIVPRECLRLIDFNDSGCAAMPDKDMRSEQRKSIALWGDSFAAALFTSFSNRAEQEGESFYPFILPSCPSMLNTRRNEDYRLGQHFSASCLEYVTGVKEAIRTIRPDVVVLTNAYLWYATAINPHDERPILLSQEREGLSGTDTVVSGIEDTVRFLNAEGIFVVLLTPHPFLRNFTHMRRMGKIYGSDSAAFDVDPSGSQALIEKTSSRLDSANLSYATISVIDYFCDRNGSELTHCSAVDELGYLLADGVHISTALAPRIVDDIFAVSTQIFKAGDRAEGTGIPTAHVD